METEEATPEVPNEVPAAYLSLVDNRSQNQSQQLLPIWDREIFKIGRNPESNTFAIDNDPDFHVSRNHCEIYVVVYEPTVNFIYVRDRKSSNGTYVNGEIIGRGPQLCPGYLVQDGDTIEIRPHWTFAVVQSSSPPRQELDNLQAEECKGSEASIHLAVEVVTKKQLVCKIVNLDRLYGKNSRRQIQKKFQEADILRQLRHPNILPYVDTITSPHTLYTFTDLASGGDLMSFIYRQDIVGEFDCRIIIRQVVQGLGYLHDKGIVHRDLKPENILLAYSPKLAYHRVMLADFGNSAVPKRSRMVTNAGTLNYQAPEFLMRPQAHTSAVDIWSLGIVTFSILTSGSGATIQDINRMSQMEILKHISEAFENSKSKPSGNGRRFIWDCLQITPTLRMTALDAACHDWLCTPEEHLKFFEMVDAKILSDWNPHDEFKSMPLELPSLKRTRHLGNEAELRSQYFATEAKSLESSTSPKHTSSSLDKDQANEYMGEEPKNNTAMSNCSMTSTSWPITPVAANSFQGEQVEKEKQVPSKEFIKPKHPTKPQNRTTRNKPPRVRIRDNALLPLTGLDRHLKPATSSQDHRKQVLRELERSNQKFLVDSSAAIPETPLDAVQPLMASAPPKRRKNVRRVKLHIANEKWASRGKDA